jgi:hypothetical protein
MSRIVSGALVVLVAVGAVRGMTAHSALQQTCHGTSAALDVPFPTRWIIQCTGTCTSGTCEQEDTTLPGGGVESCCHCPTSFQSTLCDVKTYFKAGEPDIYWATCAGSTGCTSPATCWNGTSTGVTVNCCR